ncbi:MAG: FAD-binding oxidoreductase [Gammaproteobacteria bacterium]
MRRWNGWGDEANEFPLKPEGLAFVRARLGEATPLRDASLGVVTAKVPASRLPAHPLFVTDAETRVRHARGQSLPDWLAMRSGDFGNFPDGVAFPENTRQVRELLDFCLAHDIEVIPYGGGTSVVGHITPPASARPVLTLSLAKMDRLMALDRESQLATFGAGTPGPWLEEQLKKEGYTLGHFPQSFELSTVGGWVASRSSGQQSLRYGRIEQMFAGGIVETPRGTLEIPTFPASSAGPDVREIIMGSEGRMGVLTEVKVRVTPLPEVERFYVGFLPDWDSAVQCVRALAQGKVQLSMLRVSNAVETETHLVLAGHPNLVGFLERYLRIRGIGDGKCMMTFGVTGSKAQCKAALAQANGILKSLGGVNAGTPLGRKWEFTRFRSPYLRHGLWEHGYAVDTLETSADWKNVPALVAAVEQSLRDAAAGFGEKIHVFTHLSHMYPQGSSIYTSYVFRSADSYPETHARWAAMKKAACETIVKFRSTISHQHGVGRDHAPYLPAEKGPLGTGAIRAVINHFDPQGIMIPGVLLPEEKSS